MKGLINLALGFAAGYALSRALEARAHGMRVQEAFRLDPIFMMTPVMTLAQAAAAVAQTRADAPMEQTSYR